MNTAAVSVISASRLPTPGANRIRNTSAFFRKLSLKAEKNWHQNSGAKRRVVSRDVDMVPMLADSRAIATPAREGIGATHKSRAALALRGAAPHHQKFQPSADSLSVPTSLAAT